ncbi:hypothetical protein OQJ46_09395 [Microbulbifer thermotolerans]|uniref:hypothetical protein n=1 Tax=Microbulbifer thermotolerans TaxID=252514 RepID=UPI00224B9A60|nr:hypothetical protein [Microbulbifer thermotolerans]MCX2783202.1 hypothetical protein [Microbulbifer thermotolerans]
MQQLSHQFFNWWVSNFVSNWWVVGVQFYYKTRLLFEAIEQLQDEEQAIIREVLEGMILKYEARRWTRAG